MSESEQNKMKGRISTKNIGEEPQEEFIDESVKQIFDDIFDNPNPTIENSHEKEEEENEEQVTNEDISSALDALDSVIDGGHPPAENEPKDEVKKELPIDTFNINDIDFSSALGDIDSFVTSTNEVDKHVMLNRLHDSVLRDTISVVALQSAYEARMFGLNFRSKSAIRDTSGSPRTRFQKIYNVIYNQMESMNVAKPGFDTWLKMTSYLDVETLLYGIFAKTYPDPYEYEYTCPSCSTVNKVEISPDQIIHSDDIDGTRNRIQEVIANCNTHQDIAKYSSLSNIKRVLLPVSKTIIEISIPSLKRTLELFSRFPSIGSNTTDSDIVGYMMFIRKMYLLDENRTMSTGQPQYVPIEKVDGMISVINSMTQRDEKKLDDEVEEISEKNSVRYSLPSFECVGSTCSYIFEEERISMQERLFFRLANP